MPYPPTYSRAKNFGDDQANGLPLNMTDLDTELNQVKASLNPLISRHDALTNADGTLKNLSTAQAQALSGAQRFSATGGQTVFDTTVSWATSFSNLNVLVWVNGDQLDPNTVSVANHSGSLRVTVPARTASDVVLIAAFESGAGIIGELASTATGQGAALIGIEDAGGYTSNVTVEAALQELYAKLDPAALATALALVATYLAKAGGTMTGDITFSASKTVKGLRASAANGEAVRHEQLQSVISQLTSASSTFLAKAGGTMSGDIDLASAAKVKNAPNASANGDLVPLSQVQSLISANNALPTGSVVAYAPSAAPTGWLMCDGSAVSRTTYAALFTAIGVTYGVGDGTTTFNLPDMQGRVVVGAGAGSGLSVRAIAQSGGEETHVLTTTEIPAHTHLCGYANNGVSNGGSTRRTVEDQSIAAGTKVSGSTGGGLGHNTMPPFKVLNYIIRA